MGGPKCMGKLSFASRSDAKFALANMRARGKPASDQLEVFRCPICGFHHLGKNVHESDRSTLRDVRITRAEREIGDSI